MITKQNIMMHEMIGLKVRVSSPNFRKKVLGKIVDETKNMFTIQANEKEIKVAKKKGIFEFFLGDEVVEVQGDKIMYAPQQRIKACSVLKGD